MRVSVEPEDPGYGNHSNSRPCRIWLDGVEQRGAVTADDELGMVKRCLRNEAGRLVFDENGHVRLEVVNGIVLIERLPIERRSAPRSSR